VNSWARKHGTWWEETGYRTKAAFRAGSEDIAAESYMAVLTAALRSLQ
jgi:hypothetical protein